MKKIILIFICMLGTIAGKAINTEQQIFKGNVRSLTITNPNDFMASPVIRIGSSDRLDINFDIIEEDAEYLRYRLIHCNSDWQPSRLMESEYIDGFNEAVIEDYAYSTNTYIHYVNYNISLPDPNMPILASGNYLLQVYPEEEPDDVLLQVRFSVSEEKVKIAGGVTSKTDKGVDNEYQQLFFSLNYAPLPQLNPYQDLIVVMTQNNDPSTTRSINHPMRVEQGKAIFEHKPEMVFEAGNEYRRFETVRTNYPGMHVDSVKYIDGLWNAWLKPDASRKNRVYTYDSTQRGRYKIDEYNSTDPNLSADYVLVHFTLDSSEALNGSIYVDGDLTTHAYDASNLMRYDWEDGYYHASIPLKQGSYNYRYVLITPEGKVVPSAIEGNKYETQNEYLINVFLRSPGSRGDRLVGSALLTTD